MPTPYLPHHDGQHGSKVIGVFDSGVGGLSILRCLQKTLPHHPLLYVADSAHAPYGERAEAHVLDRSMRITRHLVGAGARVIVIACNTATAVAAQHLREAWPNVPMVGVEPGIKPALAASLLGKIGVMATATTLSSAKFKRLLAEHRGNKSWHLQACTGLASAIESALEDSAELEHLIAQHCKPLRDAGVDTVVLGCTHYPFAENLIRLAIGPQVKVIDTAEAVAKQVAHVVANHIEATCHEVDPPIVLETTGDLASLERFAKRWLPFGFQCRGLSIDGHTDGARDGA